MTTRSRWWSLRGACGPTSGIALPHRWTAEGVVVETEFTGGHLYHLAAAGCVLNDVYRESIELGIVVNGVRVSARGGFETSTWVSTGVTYDVEVDTDSNESEVARLLESRRRGRRDPTGAPIGNDRAATHQPAELLPW